MNLEEVRQNSHQQHWEDMVLFGREGLEELNDKIEGFKKQLSTDAGYNITQKIDGAPAVIIGRGLKGYPEVCVGIKSFLNDPKNALFSLEEIEAKYSDRPGMASMLKYSLQLAKSIPSGEAWQGDCLFVRSTLKEREIGGANYVTFQPNKIIYAFPEGSESYDKIINSDFGVCLHTRYSQTDDGWSQSFRIDLDSLDIPSNIYVLSPALNYSKEVGDYSIDKVDQLYSKLKKLESALLANDDYENLVNNEAFMKYWNTFENANLADKGQVNLDVKSFYSDLVQYVKDKKAKEFNTKLSKLKTDKGKEKATASYNSEVLELDTILKNNKRVLILLVEALNTAANIKMLLLPGLTKNKQDYKSFLRRKSTGEYIDSDGEGISVSDAKGNIVKLVDRSKFSNANRDPDIESGFDHNESLEEDGTNAWNNKIIVKDVCKEVADEFGHKVNIGLPFRNIIPLQVDLYDDHIDRLISDVVDRLKEKLSEIDVPTKIDVDRWTIRVYYADSDKMSGRYAALKDLDLEESAMSSADLYSVCSHIVQDLFKEGKHPVKRLIRDGEDEKDPVIIVVTEDGLGDEMVAYFNTKFKEMNVKARALYNEEDSDGFAVETYSDGVKSNKTVALRDLDMEESLNEEFELDKRLVKLLGDKKDLFLKTIKKLILDHKENDVWPSGIYKPNEYEPDKLDAHDQPIQAKLDKIHNYWLDNFGLDTSKRGVSSLITSAMFDFKHEMKDSDEFKQTLDYEDANMLPPDEKFKIRLFYEWDAIQKDVFGDYDGDPGQGMEFDRWLEYQLRDGFHSEKEESLIKDMIAEIRQGGNFYNFYEDFTNNMVNTVANTDKDPAVKATKAYHKMKTKKLKKGQMIVSALCEDVDNTATVIWGRMNPITRGHLAMIKFAEEQEGDTFVFLSHSQDATKNPLPYDRKIYWAQLAAGDVVKESNSKLVLQALKEVEEMGYNKLIYICGSDRAEEMTTLLNKYNGAPDKKGNIPFTFRSIEVKQFGDERLNEDIPLEKCSASLARKCVIEDDFETFKQVVPFGDEDAEILFKELKVNMNINESFVSEALMTDKKIMPEASHDYYRMVLNDLADDGVLMSDGEKYFIDDKKVLKELDKLSSETDYKEKALRFYELTGLKWNKIEKSPYSGVSSSGKAKFSDIETTAFQEGITGLILADKLKVGNKSVINYLLESDNEKKTGVFKYIKSTPDDKFKDKWLNLINLWGSRFEALYENRNSFINEANKHLDKDVKRCIIVHPALIGSPEDGNDLLIGADTYDKSDVYYCTNLKVLDILKSLRSDPAKYSEYMFKHQNEIIGVSLKKGGKDVVIKWDPSGVTFTGDVKIVKPQKENAVTFNIEFQSNEGPVILAVRSNQGETGGGTLEFKMKGGGAQIGKAVQAFKSYLTKYSPKEAKVIMNAISSKGRDFELAAKTIVSLLTGTTKVELGETYKMTKQGAKLISTIFNLAGGFSAKNSEGKRITAPYIKVM